MRRARSAASYPAPRSSCSPVRTPPATFPRRATPAPPPTSRRTRSPAISCARSSIRRLRSYTARRMLPAFSVLHVLLSAALVGLILMHSGRDTGLGGMGFTPASQGGTHIVERNLTRLTIGVAVLFFLNTVLLFRLLQ